ncbi:MAG TPA: ABC transporter permease, partial [Rhizomicrobium sp.]
ARPNAPGFSAPEPDVSYIDAPDYLAGAAPPDFAAASRRALAQEAAPGVDGGRPLDTVIVLPAGFGAGGNAKVQIWADQQPEEPLRDFVSDALTGALRLQAVRAYAPQITDPAMLDESVELESRDPARAGARDTVADAIVPIALAVILFVVSVMNSSVLLQGVVEEKSTRMIEVLLSCATPREITSGKLIGVIAVALATLAIWAIAFFALISLVSQDTATLVLTALKSAASIDALPLLLVYFLCGLLIYGSLFLAIGSMAASLADAQSLLGPSMLILMLPNLLIGPVIRDPNGPLATAFSWIPIYTPFFMMLRIASHPPSWQLWGTAALAIATTAGMIVWTGRIFARHVLTTERPPSVAKLVAGLMGRRSR